ncbi:MAG: GNAT family N-acetyltransferase [Promicromonosporaceae bacterium]|nr:GNAT family N-acetyltransferase [Promicromonosporaceae bacterium]
MRAQRAGVSRLTVWMVRGNPTEVIAYYSVSPIVIAAADGLSRKAAGGYSQVPAWLLGRLAVARDFQGQGLGGEVLLDALETIISAATIGGGRLIVVDPIDERASAWYQRFGFVSFGPDDAQRQRRQYLPVATAIKAIGSAPG